MRLITFIFIIVLSTGVHAEEKQSNKQEMQEMKRLHSQCINSHKSSANCHNDVIKACDAPKEECLKMLERMDMEEVLESQKQKE